MNPNEESSDDDIEIDVLDEGPAGNNTNIRAWKFKILNYDS